MKIEIEERSKLIYEASQSEPYRLVLQEIGRLRKVEDRKKQLSEKYGFVVTTKRAGSGGVGSLKIRCMGEVLMQIGYGVSRHNYAPLVQIGKIEKAENGYVFNPINKQEK